MKQNKKSPKYLTTVRKWLLFSLTIVCIAAAWKLPLWQLKLVAPMYPNGLNMVAYGDAMTGDLYELNIVNHYVGMKHIDPKDIAAMSLYPVGLFVLAILALIPIFKPSWRRACGILSILFPIVILGVIQYYLYEFGHGLNPEAPIKIPEFTALALGKSTIVNFTATAFLQWGMWSLLAASFLTWFGDKIFGTRKIAVPLTNTINSTIPAVIGLLIFFVCISTVYSANRKNIQQYIDEAQSGSTVIIPEGEYNGPLRINKPVTVIGKGMTIINGDRQTDVVSIHSDSVVFKGFTIRFSGTEITQEAAGIRSEGNYVTIADNRITSVYFGIHIIQSDNVTLTDNIITPSTTYAGRPGHGINAWNVNRIIIKGNTINDARDGILLTYAKEVRVENNTISQCRYGLHSMYSTNIEFSRNYVRDNLLGLALMYSKILVAKENTIIEHRRGTSPYGMLLKDIDNVRLTGNRIQGNQIGIFSEGISMALGSLSEITDNTIIGNMIGVSIQSNVVFNFTANKVIDNLTDVQKQGDRINKDIKWSNDGKGNYWSGYRGYDRDGNAIGDLPFRVESILEFNAEPGAPEQAVLYTPGYLLLESAVKMFPIFRGDPLVIDEHPLMKMGQLTERIPEERSVVFSSVSAGVFLLGMMSVIRYKALGRNGYDDSH